MDAIGKFLNHHKRDRALYALLNDALDGYTLTEAQIRLILHMRGGTLRIADIAHELRIMPQTVGQTIKKSVAMGLLEAGELDEDDTRKRAHLLTAEGRMVLHLLKTALETEKAQALLR